MLEGLVERAQRRDGNAFDALARIVGDRCMAIAYRILRDADRADEAVQVALIIAWNELPKLREPDRFEPWLHRILTNACYAEAGRRVRWAAEIRILTTEGESSGAGIGSVIDRDELDRAFRRLTVEQRAVVVFHHYLDLPVADVADRLGIPVGTVKSRLHHAMTALRASIDADARTPTVPQERPA